MNEQNTKRFDLEDRTFQFAVQVRDFVKIVQKSIANSIYVAQLIRSSSSVGANYIEANESLSKKDFLMRIKICRKETKETTYWLKLLTVDSTKRTYLIDESIELMKIFGAIISRFK